MLSGNEHSGVQLSALGVDPAAHNDVVGNLIGTTAAGNAKLPNGGGSGGLGTRAGVAISGSDNNTIGGTAAGAGNVISANTGAGIDLADADRQQDPRQLDRHRRDRSARPGQRAGAA